MPARQTSPVQLQTRRVLPGPGEGLAMGTRAAAFTAKIRNLLDYQLRLLHGIMPVPSGVDIANTLKYFSSTLLTVLKDVPNSPLEMLKSRERDSIRLGLYPNLDYKGLYNAISQLVEVATLIQFGLQAFGSAMLQTLGCLLPFLEHDMIDSMPYLAASAMAVLPVALHQEIVNYLCYYILPFTVVRRNDEDLENYASQSLAAVIMMVFQYSDNPAHHCQLLECLMTTKKSVVKDLLCVVAYGTAGARASAAKLLFYYWPTFNPNLFDRRVVLQKFTTNLVPFVCQRDMCPNAGSAEAAKVCYDHCISITFASDSPPPLYLCIECANEIHREHTNQVFIDILHPMQQVSMTCENKNCRASDKYAMTICFSTECASYNGNRPIRYCQQCHNIRHNNRRGGDHIFHRSLPQIWDMSPEMQTYLVDAIMSLLKEAKPLSSESSKDASPDSAIKASLLNTPEISDPMTTEERQLLGRYGVWLLVGLCTPNDNTPPEILGRLLAMLFYWFDVTSFFEETQESTIERLKMDFVCDWLSGVCSTHFDVFVSCLVPHPPEYARVGGHWDHLISRVWHLKHGLHRLLCLVPYEIITSEIWDHVMPHWMEAIVNDVPHRELHELKILLSKILDPDMSPLGFDAKKLYHFVSIRFTKTSAKVQEQALNWLQSLTVLEIVIPLPLMFSMFADGVKMMRGSKEEQEKPLDKTTKTTTKPEEKKSPITSSGTVWQATLTLWLSTAPVVEDDSGNTSVLSEDDAPESRSLEFESDAELSLSCCVLMLDVLLKQMELQNVERHSGIHTSLAQDVFKLLHSQIQVSSAWTGQHACEDDECAYCEAGIMWYQLALELVLYLCPEHPVRPPDLHLDDNYDENRRSPGAECDTKKSSSDSKPDVVINMPVQDTHGVGSVLANMPHIMTATVETVTEQLDLAPILPAERVVAAVATPVHMTEADLATAKVQVARATLVGEDDAPIEDGDDDDDADFWHTSVGKFRFSLEELPQQLQFIHQLLKELPNIEQPDIIYHSLRCLHALTLHGDALTKAAKDHRGFVIWCQENLLIKNLWELSNAEHSHMSAVSVPVLLHCITLPCGTDVFWSVIQDEFHSHDWRVRFIAVERVTMIARFMDSTPLRTAYDLQGALSNAFCYLISSMDDSDVLVAQRATLYLGTIHDSAIRALIHCLETQFDSVIVDRPMVLQSLYQLHNCLSDRRILTWDFFLNRFDTLFLEAQISLEKSGDITYLRDLRNTEMNSEIFVRKLHRAHEALSQSQQSDGSTSSGVKTLSASFGPKWPYKRTMSAPATMAPRQESKQEKEKVYSRQYSAPILKRKSSRFGLGQLLGTVPASASMPDGHIHSLNAGGEEMVGFLHRVIDLEESDRETMHLLVFLLMQFLSRADQAYPTDEKHIAKAQGIVLRHLYLLLGYNHNEKGFHIPPQRLRMSPVFNVFLANLPQVFDQNHEMAWLLVPTALVVLQYCPCPHQGANIVQHQQPDYSLWFLEPHCRKSWLMSIIVLLYKYQYNQTPYSTQIQALVRIVLNTLDTQHHKCKRIPSSMVLGTGTSRSRDVSQPSLGGEPDHERFDTPPLSPLCSVDGTSGGGSSGGSKIKGVFGAKSPGTAMATHWEESVRPPTSGPKLHKYPPESSYSIDDDDTESELAAIPESPKSDSTLHGSVQGSFEDFAPIEETCCALPEETSTKPARPVIVEPAERPVAKAKLEITKPFWSLGSDQANNEKKSSGPWKWKLGSNENRCGLKEGMKMMVASPLLSISQAQVQKSVVVSQNKTPNVSTTVSNTIPKGNCSVPGPSMLPIIMPMPSTPRPFGNVGTSFFGGMQSLATAALGLEPPRPSAPAIESSPGGMNEKCDEKTRSLERWPDNPEHGSPIPRPLGRQKRVSEPAVSVAGVATSSTGGGLSWQIDLNKINQPASTAPTNLITTPITHLPWQLDLHSQFSKPTPPIASSFNQLRDQLDKSSNGGSATIHHAPIMAPAVERLLPIGNSRSTPRNIPQTVKTEEYYGSPESPLSKMDLMTVGSPIELDSENNENNDNNLSSDVTSTCSASQLEPPPQERLLPIGQQSSSGQFQSVRGGPDQLNGLVERVKMALGLPSPTYDSSQPINLPQPSQIPPRFNNEHGLIVGGYSRQDSSDKPSESSISPAHPREDSNFPSRGVSPRRLIKQLALDSSPPQLNDLDEQPSPFYRSVHYDRKPPPARSEDQLRNSQQRRVRKVGLFNAGPPSMNDFTRRPGSCYGNFQPLLDAATQAACHAEFDLKQSSLRIGEDCVYQRCSECGLIKEEYSDEELGLCIIILATFIHREPALAAPLLPEMLSVVATVALNATYPWQTEANIHLPGGASSVAHQFLRCVLHQLAPNGIFVQMFQTKIDDSTRMQFFRSVAQALLDFNELNPIAPLQLLLEGLNSKKSLPTDHLGVILHNMACYLDCLPLEVGLGPGSSTWSALLSQLEILFRRVILLLNSVEDINPLIRIMVSVLKVPGIAGFRGMLDPFGKVVSYAIQNFIIKYHYLVDLCYLCNRAFTREREKLFLSRIVVIELVQALKFKTSLPDSNFLMLINFILQDVGGALPLNIVMEDQISLGHEGGPIFTTNASECMKQHINDAVEFLADFHTISKVKSYCKGLTVGLNEDTLGGVLKSGIAQYLALEISRGSSRDNRTVARYLPWLYNAPSILQQGPREFIDCVGHIRLLSWLLLGALTHSALHGTPSAHHTHPQSPCTPVPQEASCHIADHIQVILAGFAEQSKASVLHMSSLSHAFILCQLWTVYLEQTATNNSPNSEAHAVTLSILFEFWGKVTPCILTLVSNSRVLAEMVNLHFLSLLEALHESNSMILGKLLPLWSPVLYAHHVQLPGHLQVRLQNCRNAPPWNIPAPNNIAAKNHSPNTNLVLLKWLQRLQFKMGQIELQSSAATQFYSV